ncbi:efflux RND transporter periplasmic adaptor subunit [Alisedimentitalea sp. MJ-SS2]|uniref:efflux RND transporter periplasmic adaptor subunit n=1 Tax=Aliisedimentitalea sp. MJ-SS2 TaxID=3049795 RepID=UPI0029068A5E|nr:efflux RND transporter periplasmic adaptor subunit [Alisedimentitalea sp. MJ-SS2]MDU8925873.1 efflux RND transporter periplasmic adaptor subunit [Alisedimentitalea sp. MJ-SS2]
MRRMIIAAVLGISLPFTTPAATEELTTVTMTTITEWKAVFGKVEARNNVPARSRIGGTLTEITVSEGTDVTEGQQIGTIYDAKLALQLDSIVAQVDALQSQLENAQTELTRGEDLLKRGVTTVQRLDALRTQVDVLTSQIESIEAEKRVIEQRAAEGAVLAPISGRVLTVPVTTGSVLMPGEVVSMIGGGGFYLRLAVPERHAAFLREGADIQIGEDGSTQTGKLAKVYPQIQNGRVIADVEMSELGSGFVDARVLVRLPVGETSALLVPADLVVTRMGLDFVTVKEGEHGTLRAIVPGEHHVIDGKSMIEVLSGLSEGENVTLTKDVAYTPAKDHGNDGH